MSHELFLLISDAAIDLVTFKQMHPDKSNGIYSNPETSQYEETLELYACPDMPAYHDIV